MTPEAAEWLGLHRAHEGGVTTLAGDYLNHGRPVASYLADVLDGLISAGLLALGQPSPSGQQVCVTHTGQNRYARLCTPPRPSHHGSGAR